MAGYRELLALIDEEAIDAAGRPRLRACLVETGNDPNRTAELARHLGQRNDGLEATRVLLHWAGLIAGDSERRVDGFRETTRYVLAPAVVTGVGAPLGGLALVATIGSGGAFLVGAAGAGLAAMAVRGLLRVRDRRNLVESDLTALRALEARLRACEADILRRQGG